MRMVLLSSSLDSLIQLVGVLVIFAFVLLVTYFVTRWVGGYQKRQLAGRLIQVVDSVQVAGNKFIAVVKVGDAYLVVAIGKDEVTMLAKLTEDEIGLSAEDFLEKKDSQESFQEALGKFRDRFSKKRE